MCWDDAHCMSVNDFATNATCVAKSACILPQRDPVNAHNVIWYNITSKAECETASLGVSSSITVTR